MIPAMAFKPPATLEDVLAFLQKASKENDSRKEGVNFLLETADGESVPVVPKIRANNLTVYNAVELVTRITGYDFEVKGNIVVIFKEGGAAKKGRQKSGHEAHGAIRRPRQRFSGRSARPGAASMTSPGPVSSTCTVPWCTTSCVSCRREYPTPTRTTPCRTRS